MKLFVLVVLFVTLLAALPATAINYRCLDLGTLGGGWSQAFAINENNVITGTAQRTTDIDEGFIWQNGSMSGVGTLGSKVSWAYGINIHNQIVGWSSPLDGTIKGFVYDDAIHKLDPLWGNTGDARGINDQGHVAGYSQDSTGYAHATRWVNGIAQDLGVPSDYFCSRAYGINNLDHVFGYAWTIDGRMTSVLWDENGQSRNIGNPNGYTSSGLRAINNLDVVVGRAVGGTETVAFYWNGTMHTLAWLSDIHTAEAIGINDSGQIVGYALDAQQLSHPTMWNDGELVDLSQYMPGWSGATAYDINNNGIIVGTGTNPDGHLRGFLLTPVPEPTSIFGLIAGLATLTTLKRRKKR